MCTIVNLIFYKMNIKTNQYKYIKMCASAVTCTKPISFYIKFIYLQQPYMINLIIHKCEKSNSERD